MNLTPIHIRGKRKNRSSAVSSSSIPSKKMTKRSLSSVLADRSGRHRPCLDALPGEILEKIFLYSTNLSLPEASPCIGVKLSDRATLIRLFIWAFHDTWDQNFGVAVRFGPTMGPDLPEGTPRYWAGDPELQTAVLGLPWVDIDFILQAQQTWADKYAKGRYYQHAMIGSPECSLPPLSAEVRLHSCMGGFNHFNARKCFEIDYGLACEWAHVSTRSGHRSWAFQEVHPMVRVPIDIVTGPWDEEMLRRLFWFARAGALCFGAEGHHPAPVWEVCVELFRNSILDPPEPVDLACVFLHTDHFFTNLPNEIVRREMRRLADRIVKDEDTLETRHAMRLFAVSLRSSRGFPNSAH